MHALVLSYSLRDASSGEHGERCEQIAPAAASVSGLASATWLSNAAAGRYGVFFVFETKPDFDRFVASELFGTFSSHSTVNDLSATDYSISERPTALTRGPVLERI